MTVEGLDGSAQLDSQGGPIQVCSCSTVLCCAAVLCMHSMLPAHGAENECLTERFLQTAGTRSTTWQLTRAVCLGHTQYVIAIVADSG